MRKIPHFDEDEGGSDENNGKVEMSLISRKYKRNSSQYQPKKEYSTTSIFARTPVKPTEGYEQVMFQERSLFLLAYLIFVILSPLVFRYAMGSNLVPLKGETHLLDVKNATISTYTDWSECIACKDVYGVTLYNLTVVVSNVTSPNPDGRTPSVAVFASQDLVNWYSAYRPNKVQDAFIDNWQSTTFTIFNGTEMACLGGVYHNYLVVCLNAQDIATTLHLGDKISGPPFNDRCFQMQGICGVPCVSSVDMAYPLSCDAGMLEMKVLSSNETITFDSTVKKSIWMSGLNWVEWIVLITIFLDCFGNVLRYLPVVSGRPTELESARNCLCEGVTVLGCTSPFVSEDEAIFLRSLIGRTATVFHTVGGRHNLHGMYLDTILNEKRGKGEANRFHLWLSWIEFITLLARIGVDDSYIEDEDIDIDHDDDYNDDNNQDESSFFEQQNDLSNESKRNPFRSSQSNNDNNNGLRHSFMKQNSTATTDAQTRGTRGARRSTITSIPQNLHPRASISGFTNLVQPMETPVVGGDFASLRVNSTEVVNFDKKTRSNSTIINAGTFKNQDFYNNSRLSESKPRQSQMSINFLDTRINRIPSINENDEENDEDDNDFEYEEREIDPFDPEEDLEFDMADLLPLICFLDGWLEAVKDKEWTFNYRNKSEGLECIFNAAPLEVYFQGNDLLLAHNCLKNLYDAFVGDVKDEKDHGMPIHPEVYEEINWIICRRGLPDWNVSWSYMSRARLRPMSNSAMSHPPPPQCLFETTRIKPGAIVYRVPEIDSSPHDAAVNWLSARMATYKVIKFEKSSDGQSALIVPWPEMKRPNGEPYDDRDPSPILVSVEELALVEQNRGKAGALNVYKDFLSVKATTWVAEQEIPGPVQVFMAIIDARHMLAEPEIFWNDALPFFSRNKESGESAKDYGEITTDQQCIMVQYPQFFTNVTRDDFLDNKNSAYYTIWQTLRDCGKCITSSGTNAIWEITDPTFAYATTSRIEDTGTSQKYIPQYMSVHLPCFVAYGVAKQTEDYIEAVYRWSTGAVELFWSTVSTPKNFGHYILIFFICLAYGLAAFGESGFWYFLWIVVLIATAIQGSTDKANGHRPLRKPIVSSTIVLNTMYWISNLASTVWMILIPIQIAIYSTVPLSQSVTRSLFWGFAALLLRLPPAVMTDRIVAMCRFLSLKTDEWNYSMVLWRSSQLYSCSFAYSTLSILTGTSNSVKALQRNADLTMWSSFRVSDAAFKTALDKILHAESYFSAAFFTHLFDYLNLFVKSIIASFSMPDVLTKWWALFLFSLQVTCIFLSLNVTNVGDTTTIFVTLVVCGLNLLLCIDITILLCPSITLIIGRPARPEYVFAFLGFTVIISALVHGRTSFKLWSEIVKIGVSY